MITNVKGFKKNRWTILCEVNRHYTKNGTPLRKVYALCSCGNKKEILLNVIINGKTKSCGCLQKERAITKNKKHGMSGTRFYNTFMNIKKRCKRGLGRETRNHGDKGIQCEWENFNDFKNDMYETYIKHSNTYGEKNTTIERVNNDGNYCKENCKWATIYTQNRNKKTNIIFTYNKKTQILMDWCIELGLPYKKINYRINNGWSMEEALGFKKRIKHLYEVDGDYDLMKNWIEKYKVSYSTVQKKMKKGFSLKKALITSKKLNE